MSGRELRLPAAAANYLCTRYDLQLHPLLRVGWLPVDATEQDRAEAAELGRRQLGQQGLLDADGLHPFVDDAIRLLARPPLAVGLAVNLRDGENFNAVLAEYGRSTVQAYQADGETPDDLRDIVVKRQEFGGPAGNVANLLGKIDAAEGASVSVPYDKVKQIAEWMSRGEDKNLSAALGHLGVRGAAARTLTTALTAKRDLEGLLTVRAFDEKVRRTRSLPFGTQFFNTEAGWFFAQRKPGRDGQEWYILAPADARKLTGVTSEMIKLLTSPTARI
ncbi:ESX secretion-associated protein EspG [Saccharopolyspora griseoalba]|uniref:ESX secretion-associated protein EspG n=1 Tax=Saccharopolyspora griseoalba TaxID=1431848 RepID=A0ABW2LDV8_9PSEU